MARQTPWALLLAVALAAPAAAQWRAWESDYDEDAKRWTEIQAKMPPYPKAENLIPFEASGGTRHHFFIDGTSLSVGEDGVVRYTLMVKTAGGATNVSFEGIRCETIEQKYYATGRADGSWVRARGPQWRLITNAAPTPHHAVLFRDFFCAGRAVLPSAREITDALKRASWNVR